jgi:DGQHR domain-containing protein
MTDSINQFESGTRLIVQRGEMGGCIIYTALLTLREQNSLVPPRPETGMLETREQRLTDPSHAAEIAEYIADVDDYFLPGVMVFLHDDENIKFEPLKDKHGKVLTERVGTLWVSAKVGRSLGDAMHRGVGIEATITTNPDLGEDNIVVSFVVEPDQMRRRLLFNDVNRTQKRVAKSLGVSYDRRDPVSIAVNEVVDDQPLGVLIEHKRGTAGRGTGKLMTTGTLFDAVSMVLYGWSGKPGRRTGKAGEDEARAAAALIISALTSLPDIAEALDAADPGDEINLLRERSILGSGATVKALGVALFVATGRLKDQEKLRQALKRLSADNWDPKAWVEIGFVPSGGRTPS